MTTPMLNAARALCLAPIMALGLLSGAQAQTAKAPMPNASMPSSGMPSSGMPKMPMQKGMGDSGDMKKSMMMGMDNMQKMPMSGDTDKDFAMMMKIHHQGALDMAQMELEQGKSAEMKVMAKKIIAAQKKEIAQFDKWLAKQK